MAHSLSCFWSLLDIDSLNFLYVSPAIPHDISSNFLITKSLFDLLHPEETVLARSDLAAFVSERSLAGSITRCRLRNVFGPDGPYEAGHNWCVVDIVLYVASDSAVLALFHVDPGRAVNEMIGRVHVPEDLFFHPTCTHALPTSIESQAACHETACGEKIFGASNDDANFLRVRLKNLILSRHPPQFHHLHPHRVFQIFNSRTKTVLFSWPENYHNDSSDPALSNLVTLSNGVSCTQCSRHSTRTVTPSGDLSLSAPADHILIPYGRITFAISQIPSAPMAAQNSLYHSAVGTVQQQPSLVQTVSTRSTPSLHLQLPSLSSFAANSVFSSPGHPVPFPHAPASPLVDTGMRFNSPLPEPFFKKQRSFDHFESGRRRLTPSLLDENDRDSIALHKNTSDPSNKGPFVPYARRNITSSQAFGPSSADPPLSTNVTASPTTTSTRRSISSPNIVLPPDLLPSLDLPPKRKHSSSARTNSSSNSHKHHYNHCGSPTGVPQQQNHCESCGTGSSPEWRKGPSGHKTLCNACGLRYWRSVARKEKLAQQQKARCEIYKALEIAKQQQPQHQQGSSTPSSPASSCSSPSSSLLSPASPVTLPFQPNSMYIDKRYDTHAHTVHWGGQRKAAH